MSGLDARSTRALQLTETASVWRRLVTRDGEPIVGMPSQTVKGLYYLVTETTCTCEDHRRHGLRPQRIGDVGLHMLCKHIRAVHFERLQREQEQEYAF